MQQESRVSVAAQRPHWHTLDSGQVPALLDCTTAGLTLEEAQRRIGQYGPNRLRPAARRGPLLRFLTQFHNVLIYILLASAVITALLQHWVDSGVILGVVVINAIIGFIQEGKAERALDAIRNMLSPQATALRDGRFATISAEDLVPGDVVLVQSGDKVPADLRLFKVRNLRVDEAALTGESEPVEKTTEPVDANAAIGDRSGMAYAGTLVTYGQGMGLVVATGDVTEIGRISAMLARVSMLMTPLLQKMAHFGRVLTVIILVLAGVTFAVGTLVHDFHAGEMFIAAVALAVAAIPEGLPAIVTITLAIGVQRMARRHVIIRRLPAVETLGSVTVICSDKTGTLTRNEMTAQTAATADCLYEVSGAGYAPHGGFHCGGAEALPDEDPQLIELVRAGLLCNDANIVERDGAWTLTGDPTEGALVTLALKAGLEHRFEQEARPRDDVIPFESQHRFMATLHHDHAGHSFIYVKGAPERLLEMCSHQRHGGEDRPIDLRYWHAHIESIASRGQRPLAVGFRAAGEGQRELRFEDVEAGLTLLGVFGLMDPPRAEAISAVAECQGAGIRVKMITGDHRLTARVIGAQLGIGDGEHVLTGPEIEAMDDQQLRRCVLDTDVFARASPEHKLRLVQALQAHRQVLAMTGDGVNDAPALKRADVGVAMGMKGTEVAKEASEIVLTDDNFASIVAGVEEGRTVFDNIRKAIIFILPTNMAEGLIVIAAIALGVMLPITPVQILWVNMITAVTLALALAFEPSERGVMDRPPRDPRASLLSPLLMWRVVFVSLIMVAGTYGLFLLERANGGDLATARTIAVNTLVVCEAFYLLNTRYIQEPCWNRTCFVGNRIAVYAIALVMSFQWLFTYAPPMQTLFSTAAIDARAWLHITGVGAVVFVLVEVEKVWLRRRAAARRVKRA